MLTRHEEAQQLRSDKIALDLAWDDQRRLENELRESRVKQRNAELYEQHNAKDIKQVNELLTELFVDEQLNEWMNR